MSINFYATTPGDNGDSDGLHIGQDAAGMEFLFRAHRTLGLTTARAWHDFLNEPGVRIIAETGDEYPLEEFWPRATLRPAAVGGPRVMRPRWPGGAHRADEWSDMGGHPFADYEFC